MTRKEARRNKKMLAQRHTAVQKIVGWSNRQHTDDAGEAAQKFLTNKATNKQIECARSSVPPLMIPQPAPEPKPIIPPPQKRCPRCGAPLIINDGGYGTYFECGTCGYIGG